MFSINNVFSTVNEAEEETKNAERVVNEFADKVQQLNDRVQAADNYNVRSINEQIANSKQKVLLKHTHNFFSVSVSRSRVENMVRSLQDVKNRASKHESQIKNIRSDLNVLKEKINEAREKASKIKIAVRADEEQTCSREYISPLNPSPANTIILKYRPALDAPDSLIFFTSTQGTRTVNFSLKTNSILILAIPRVHCRRIEVQKNSCALQHRSWTSRRYYCQTQY